jgi:DNA-binding transcriptional LysR family regulator
VRNLPTELLRTFLTVVDTGSFTRAGDIVGRSQSAVSLQVRRLEDFLDARLFVRDTHSLSLTDEGLTLVGYARRMLALNDEALSSLRRPKMAGCLRLGAPNEYSASLLPVILGEFAQVHPGVMLEVTSELSKNLLERMDKGHFDLVVALHDDPSDVRGTKVHTDPLVWVTSIQNSVHEKSPLSLVVAPAPCIYRDHVLQTLNRLGLPWRIAYSSSSYSGILAAVRSGLGVTLLAASTVPDRVRRLGTQDGFPDMGSVDVRIHTAPERGNEAVLYLADYIARCLR